MSPIEPSRLRSLAEHSVAVIRSNQAPSGGYLASPNFPVYRYSWLRDGAFIADAMSRVGAVDSAEAFFGWCNRILQAHRSQIDDLLLSRAAGRVIDRREFLPARFTLEGDRSAEEWTDFQLDGYGAWLWALDGHVRRHGRTVAPYLAGAELSARYIAGFWDHPCYDWWEEHPDQVHTSTLAAIYGGLRAAATWTDLGADQRAHFAATAREIRDRIVLEGRRAGHLTKWLGSDALDASLVAVATPFDVLEIDDPLVQATVAGIEATLVDHGGVYRYLGDTYYGGGQWLILAGFLGWHQARLGRIDKAMVELEWIAAQATPEGDLPEQVDHRLLEPAQREPWIKQWGPIANPLLWSHAMYLTLAVELGIVRSPEVSR